MRVHHLVLFLYSILFANISYSQIIIIDPPSINLEHAGSQFIYENQNPVRLRIISEFPWSVSCVAEPLLNETGGFQIKPEKLFIKHDLTSEYQPMISTIDLGTGQPTGSTELLVNSLYFKVELNGNEPAGIYHGIIRFLSNQNNVVQLMLAFEIENRMQIDVSPQTINFITSMPGFYAADLSISLAVSSNSTDWHVEASAVPHTQSAQSIADNLYIRSSFQNDETDDGAGAGFRALDIHPTILSGSQCGHDCSTLLEFKLLTEWMTKSGEYQVTIELNIPEYHYSRQIVVNVYVSEYSVLALSESEVYFHANGPPAIWDGDKAINLTVGTNCSFWTVMAEATDLTSESEVIPNERIFLKIDPDDFTANHGAGAGYYKMNVPIEVATGAESPPHDVCQMQFRLKTLDIDSPGHYEGTVTFTHLTNP